MPKVQQARTKIQVGGNEHVVFCYGFLKNTYDSAFPKTLYALKSSVKDASQPCTQDGCQEMDRRIEAVGELANKVLLAGQAQVGMIHRKSAAPHQSPMRYLLFSSQGINQDYLKRVLMNKMRIVMMTSMIT